MMLETLQGLVESGHRVVVTMPWDGALRAEVERCGGRVVITATPVLRKAYKSVPGLARLASEAASAVRPNTRLLRAEDPDVVYVSTVTVPLWIVLANYLKIPVVCHVHEAEKTASRTTKRVLAAPLLRADSVLVNSKFSIGVLADAFPSLESRSELVYNGVRGPDVVVPPRETLSGPLRLLYVGRLSERKGVDVAVDAVAALRDRGFDAVLTIVGAVFPGYEDFETGLRRRVAELGLREQVRFAGFVPEAWSQVADSDVVLVPSRVDEPFGNTAVEAVLGARPVIVSRIGGLPEAVEGFRSAQIVPPDDADAIARAVRRGGA